MFPIIINTLLQIQLLQQADITGNAHFFPFWWAVCLHCLSLSLLLSVIPVFPSFFLPEPFLVTTHHTTHSLSVRTLTPTSPSLFRFFVLLLFCCCVFLLSPPFPLPYYYRFLYSIFVFSISLFVDTILR